MIDCLVVGSVGLDDIETPTRSEKMIVGGSATYFANAAKHFCHVGVVGVIGRDFTEQHLSSLNSNNIDYSGIVRQEGKTFHWHGRYNGDLSAAETILTELGVFQDFDPLIPTSFKKVRNLFLANIDPELQLRVLSNVSVDGIIALDTMNFWIESKLDILKKVLQKVDLLFINDQEAKSLSGETDILKICQVLSGMGPRSIVVKRGGYGAFMYQEGEIFILPCFPKCKLVDTTGAGDSFAGGFMGAIAQKDQHSFGLFKQALVSGTIMASFAIEEFSVKRTNQLSTNEIKERHNDFMQMVSLDS